MAFPVQNGHEGVVGLRFDPYTPQLLQYFKVVPDRRRRDRIALVTQVLREQPVSDRGLPGLQVNGNAILANGEHGGRRLTHDPKKNIRPDPPRRAIPELV